MHISLKHVLEKTNSLTKIIIILQSKDSLFQFNLKLGSLVSWFICFSRNRFFLIFGGSLNRHGRRRLRPVENLGKLPHLKEPLQPCLRMFPFRL